METTFDRDVESRNKAWLLLGVAILCEIGGAIGLRFSAGFTVFVPTALALGAFCIALFLVSRVMRQLPVSIAYPVWAGGGTAGPGAAVAPAAGCRVPVSRSAAGCTGH